MAFAQDQSAHRKNYTKVVADVDLKVERPGVFENPPSSPAAGSSSAKEQTGLAASGAVAFAVGFGHASRDGCCH